jgi:hypothetical protein
VVGLDQSSGKRNEVPHLCRPESDGIISIFRGEKDLSCGEIGVVLTERESMCEKKREREMATAHGRGFPFRNAGQQGFSWHKITED